MVEVRVEVRVKVRMEVRVEVRMEVRVEVTVEVGMVVRGRLALRIADADESVSGGGAHTPSQHCIKAVKPHHA